MRSFGQRQGFLVSAAIHLALLMILISGPLDPRPTRDEAEATEAKEKVFLPSAEELRKLMPLRTRPAPPRPAPAPLPPPREPESQPENQKDRISVGPPVAVRQTGPMVLRREDDLTKAPKGRPDGQPAAEGKAVAGTSAPAQAPAEARTASAQPKPDQPAPNVTAPPGVGRGTLPRAAESSRRMPLPQGALAASIDRSVARQMERTGPLGLASGSGQQLGAFFFDPQGADFSVWLNHGKNEIYRNWIMPQSVMLGFSGAVTFEFAIERDGRMSALQLIKSSGVPALDRAARNGLTGALWMPLPSDYRPTQLTLRVTFIYGNAPQDL